MVIVRGFVVDTAKRRWGSRLVGVDTKARRRRVIIVDAVVKVRRRRVSDPRGFAFIGVVLVVVFIVRDSDNHTILLVYFYIEVLSFAFVFFA